MEKADLEIHATYCFRAPASLPPSLTPESDERSCSHASPTRYHYPSRSTYEFRAKDALNGWEMDCSIQVTASKWAMPTLSPEHSVTMGQYDWTYKPFRPPGLGKRKKRKRTARGGKLGLPVGALLCGGRPIARAIARAVPFFDFDFSQSCATAFFLEGEERRGVSESH